MPAGCSLRKMGFREVIIVSKPDQFATVEKLFAKTDSGHCGVDNFTHLMLITAGCFSQIDSRTKDYQEPRNELGYLRSFKNSKWFESET